MLGLGAKISTATQDIPASCRRWDWSNPSHLWSLLFLFFSSCCSAEEIIVLIMPLMENPATPCNSHERVFWSLEAATEKAFLCVPTKHTCKGGETKRKALTLTPGQAHERLLLGRHAWAYTFGHGHWALKISNLEVAAESTRFVRGQYRNARQKIPDVKCSLWAIK